ncbi:jg8224 [Pararge aegeria aegeria]|uniref:Jg8224 protein n=1 Tax=Pararge aegeria aegeria TaxID=348720 RepID=A0A8S4SN92_9NEOP|nr:jg8224 [Pararge aegeria aegeria]
MNERKHMCTLEPATPRLPPESGHMDDLCKRPIRISENGLCKLDADGHMMQLLLRKPPYNTVKIDFTREQI